MPRRKADRTIAALGVVAIAATAAVFSGCGDDTQDQVNQALDDAQQQIEEASQDAQDQAEQIQNDIQGQIDQATGDETTTTTTTTTTQAPSDY
ncbi:MAG: hypothetical protein ACHQJ5_07660 [Vicinamibacteria bacterium]